jgi:uncharacterized protein (TIGR03663 family)
MVGGEAWLISQGEPRGSAARLWSAAAFLCLMAVACVFRFPHIADRPMHCDEAVNADRLGVLIEHSKFEYSMEDMHGPSLAYLSLIPARIKGLTSYAQLDETTIRSVTAVAGVLLVGVHFFLIPYIGLEAALFAAGLVAVSPAMVYYSRYYIHEMLLVLLTLGLLLSVLRYASSKRPGWALSIGLFGGLMFATKETAPLAFLCLFIAGIAAGRARWRDWISGRDAAIAIGAGAVVTLVLMSSFFTNPRGVVDSIAAFSTYAKRGMGIGTIHVHPWYYYLNLLLFFRAPGGPVWTEVFIFLLAAPAVWAALKGRAAAGVEAPMLRFLACYAGLMLVIYSAIPHKAPWNALSFLHAWILLAGIGGALILKSLRRRPGRLVAMAVLALGFAHLGERAWAASGRYSADQCNPWVYAHTGWDVYPLMERIRLLAQGHPDGQRLPVWIVTRENLWPLPWYFRGYPNVRWWNGVSETAPAPPIIIATPDMEPGIIHKLYELPPPGHREMYMNLFERYAELRPRVEIRGYVIKSLWDALPESAVAAMGAAQ